MLVGIEAVSRGAKKAILCDQSKEAIRIIQKNREKTHTIEQTEVYQMPFEKLLKNEIKEQPDIVYIDPPYQTNFAYEAVKIMNENQLLKEDSLIIIETDQEEKVINQLKNLKVEIIQQRKYGRVNLIFLNKRK